MVINNSKHAIANRITREVNKFVFLIELIDAVSGISHYM